MVVRFYFIKHHYRGPLDFSMQDIEVAEKTYKRLINFFADVTPETCHQEMKKNLIVQAMSDCLSDDFNTSGLFGVLFESLDSLHNDVQAKSSVKGFLSVVIGLTLVPIAEKMIPITEEIQELLDARQQARTDKNWSRADELRDQLKRLGFQVQDKKI
jgi:cysteinyl-tRNA synthetase